MHMVTEKAIARALRGHYLVETAIVEKLMATIISPEIGFINSNEDGDYIDVQIENVLSEDNDMTPNTVEASEYKLQDVQVIEIKELLIGVMDHSETIEGIHCKCKGTIY